MKLGIKKAPPSQHILTPCAETLGTLGKQTKQGDFVSWGLHTVRVRRKTRSSHSFKWKMLGGGSGVSLLKGKAEGNDICLLKASLETNSSVSSTPKLTIVP